MAFLEKTMKKAGLLKNGTTRFPFFIYNEYKINSIENIMMMHTMKYIYKCKFDKMKPNLVHYKAGLAHLSSMCLSMSEHRPFLIGVKRFRECLTAIDVRAI